MSRVLCVCNQKGGVGKTTTAVNLASAVSRAGKRSLLIDLDPQCNSTSNLGHSPANRHPLLGTQALRESVCSTGSDLLELLPGSSDCQDLNILSSGSEADRLSLAHRLVTGAAAYDIVLIDCPPSLGALTEAALAAATEVLMPIQCEYFAMEGLTQMIQVIRKVMARRPNQLQFGGILLTMYDHRLMLTREVDEEVREFFGEIVFETVIPRDVAVSEAPSHQQSVIEYSPRSRGARAYVELCMEVLERD